VKRTKQIREALFDFNLSKLLSECGKQTITDKILLELVELVKQTGCLLLQHAVPAREAQRDSFFEALRRWLSAQGSDAATDLLDRHRRQAALCEYAFREVYASLGSCPVGKIDPAVAAWTALFGTASDMAEIQRALSSMPPALIAPNLVYLSSESLRISAMGSTNLDADAVAERYAYNLGGYLKMLGHRYGWFRDANLVIPAQTDLPADLVNDRSALYLAEAWNQLEDHWDKLRYFDTSSVRSERRSYVSGEDRHEANTFVFEHDWPPLLEIEVARTRLRRQVFEIILHVMYSQATSARLQDPTGTHVDLPPRGLISAEEASAVIALDMCYGLQLKEDTTEYLGLKLAEWLRGYSLLQFCCQRGLALTKIADGLCYLDLDAFLSLAGRAAMSRERVLQFITQITFQKNSRDLFDAPLIQTSGNRYVLFPVMQAHSGIQELLTSRINSLLLQVERKGFAFEDEVRQEFADLGAVAKRIEYRNVEGNFECDGAVLWGRNLFLVECKAYTLPQPSGADIFFFKAKQEEAANQIRRISRHFLEDPSILEKAFGHELDVSSTTLCVMNLAPFWTSTNQPVKFYDRRALSKFSGGTITAIICGRDEPSAERTIARLWAGERATPEDLINQMDSPFQHITERQMWGIRQIVVPVSNDLVIISPVIERRPDPIPGST